MKKVFALSLVFVALTGCKPEPSATSVPAASPDARLVPITDPMAPRYEVSLAEGIDFKRDGFPKFLAEVTGLSAREAFGRWSEGPVVKFRFKEPLPAKFVLSLDAGAFGPNAGQPTTVRVGTVERQFTPQNDAATFTLSFEGVASTDTVEIIPPKPTAPKDLDPASNDLRVLGLALIGLRVQQ